MGNQVHSKAIFQFQGKGLENEVRGKPGEDSSSSHVQNEKNLTPFDLYFQNIIFAKRGGGRVYQEVFAILIKTSLPYSSRKCAVVL